MNCRSERLRDDAENSLSHFPTRRRHLVWKVMENETFRKRQMPIRRSFWLRKHVEFYTTWWFKQPPTDNTRPNKFTDGHFHHSIFLLASQRENHENTKNNLINKNTQPYVGFTHFRTNEYAKSVDGVQKIITNPFIHLISIPVNTFMEKSDPGTTSDRIESSFAEINL